MNKKLIAALVAGAFVAPMAAKADNNNVVLYGAIKVAAEWNKNYASDDNFQVTDYNSRIGFKGEEALGGGLKAIWQVENAVRADVGGTAWASRNSFVGLEGGFGTVRLGTFDIPSNDFSGGAVTLFECDPEVPAMGGKGYNCPDFTLTDFDTRFRNSISYSSPKYSGFGFNANFAAGEKATNNGDAYGVQFTYDANGIVAALDYNNANEGYGPVVGRDNEMFRGILGFTFGNAYVAGGYQKQKSFAGERDDWIITGSYAMGNVTLKASAEQWGESEKDGTTFDEGEYRYIIGADYNFSKRTFAQVSYGYADNQNANTEAGQTFGVALIHKF